jgi:SagB-type dehydrogenase family enzyme
MYKLFLLSIIVSLILMQEFAMAQTNIVKLPEPKKTGGMPLMEALSKRHSDREFSTQKLSLETLSNLLWAGYGINRKEDKKRTVPSSMNYQEIDVYCALPDGLYLYDAVQNSLIKIVDEDIREFTGKQDFVKSAGMNIIYVADYSRIEKEASEYQYRASYANSAFIAQNVYLYCASEGLATVIRAFFDESVLSTKMKLKKNCKIILCQTVGYPKK